MSGASRSGEGKVREGSACSNKAMHKAARDGKKITAVVGGQTFEGYLTGMDNFHWSIITLTGETVLIHKGSTPIIKIEVEPSLYQDRPNKEDLLAATGPFRAWVLKNVFKTDTAAPAA